MLAVLCLATLLRTYFSTARVHAQQATFARQERLLLVRSMSIAQEYCLVS
jgi:hypothetical protein